MEVNKRGSYQPNTNNSHNNNNKCIDLWHNNNFKTKDILAITTNTTISIKICIKDNFRIKIKILDTII